MPNGKPGDHPLSDLRYGRGTGYGEAFDALALALLERPGAHHEEVEHIVSYMPGFGMVSREEMDAAVAQALHRLRTLRDGLDGAQSETAQDA
ncbi:hypothetical protein [Xanthomonas sp. 1678]|uniref:hypothetical protein n=1 Tax=Xanthomonas sp. 1678 TaxID=3158788 RepID=UPI00285C6795|nr:hypothetical protein [Xanthomonas translucens]MEB1529822.1 hypothetical protein [Xanthomonas campestris pv. campestris]